MFLWHASCNPQSCDHTLLDTGHIQERVPNRSETSAMLLLIDGVVGLMHYFCQCCVLFHQSILVCAGKSVDLLQVNTHLLASFLCDLFAEAEFGVWEMSRQHAVLQMHEMGGTGRCPCTKWGNWTISTPVLLQTQFLEIHQDWNFFFFFLVFFLVHCNQDFYFIITMHTVSSVLRL